MSPNRRLSGFVTKKLAKVTLFSLRSVMWASNMPKIRWRPSLPQIP